MHSGAGQWVPDPSRQDTPRSIGSNIIDAGALSSVESALDALLIARSHSPCISPRAVLPQPPPLRESPVLPQAEPQAEPQANTDTLPVAQDFSQPTYAVIGSLLAQLQHGITVVMQQKEKELHELRSENQHLLAAMEAAGLQVPLRGSSPYRTHMQPVHNAASSPLAATAPWAGHSSVEQALADSSTMGPMSSSWVNHLSEKRHHQAPVVVVEARARAAKSSVYSMSSDVSGANATGGSEEPSDRFAVERCSALKTSPDGTNSAVTKKRHRRLSVRRCSQVLSKPCAADDAENVGKVLSRKPKVHGALFRDVHDMKAEVRHKILRPYDVVHFYHGDGVVVRIAKSQAFELTTLAVVAVNALWLAFDVDANGSQELAEKPVLFIFAEYIFFAYFAVEWFIRFLAFNRKLDGLRDAWFVFDGILLALMCVDTFMPFFVESKGSQTSVLRLVKLVKMARMARVARLLRKCPELTVLIKAMAVASRSVVSTVGLLIIAAYIFSVALRYLTIDSLVGEEYFGSVTNGMKVLLFGALMPDLEPLFDALYDTSPVNGLLLILFGALAGLTLMNMLIGILCEVINAVAQVENEATKVTFIKDQLLQVVKNMDDDADMMISKEEFEALLVDPMAVKAMSSAGVDPLGLLDMTDYIFGAIHGDEESTKALSFEAIVEILISLGGSNPATVKDVVDLRRVVTDQMENLEEMLGLHSLHLQQVAPFGPAPPTDSPTSATLPTFQNEWLDVDSFLQGGNQKPFTNGSEASMQKPVMSSNEHAARAARLGSFDLISKGREDTRMSTESSFHQGSHEKLDQVMAEVVKSKLDTHGFHQIVQEMLSQVRRDLQSSTAHFDLRFAELHRAVGQEQRAPSECGSTLSTLNANREQSSREARLLKEKLANEVELAKLMRENRSLQGRLDSAPVDTSMHDIQEMKRHQVQLQELHDIQVTALEQQVREMKQQADVLRERCEGMHAARPFRMNGTPMSGTPPMHGVHSMSPVPMSGTPTSGNLESLKFNAGLDGRPIPQPIGQHGNLESLKFNGDLDGRPIGQPSGQQFDHPAEPEGMTFCSPARRCN